MSAKALSIVSLYQNEFDGPNGRPKSSTIGKIQYNLKPLGGGLVRYEIINDNEMKSTTPGKPIETSHQGMRHSGISVGNGLIALNDTMLFGNVKVEQEVRQIEKMSGTLVSDESE